MGVAGFDTTPRGKLAEADRAVEEGITKEVIDSEEERESWAGADVSIGSPGGTGKPLERAAAEDEKDTLVGRALASEIAEDGEDIVCPLELTGKEVEAADVIT